MHVLFIPKWYPGRKDPQLGDFLRKQAQAADRHVRMSVLYIAPDKDQREALEVEHTVTDGLWELRCYYRQHTHPWAPLRKAVNLLRYARAARSGIRRVRKERGAPDIIHAYILVRPALIALWQRWTNGTPFLVSEQSSEYLDGTFARKSRLHKALGRWLCGRASAVTAVSPWLGDALVGHGLYTTYDVVPNVVPGLDRPLPPAGTPGRFLVVADLVDRTKNVSGVLNALALARQELPELSLTIIGDGPDRPKLEQQVKQLGLGDQVRFLGRLPNTDVLDHVARAFAMIVNSNVETFSVVTGEALAQGRPVIATRCGGPTAFVNNSNGILIEPRDDAALAQAMVQLTKDAARYEPATIRAGVNDRFSPDAVGRRFADIYARILGRP